MQGNPPPTPLYAAHRFAQRGFPRRLGPSRVAPSTLNEILKQHFKKTNKKFKRAGFRKPAHVCDSMDLCACGFETRNRVEKATRLPLLCTPRIASLSVASLVDWDPSGLPFQHSTQLHKHAQWFVQSLHALIFIKYLSHKISTRSSRKSVKLQ